MGRGEFVDKAGINKGSLIRIEQGQNEPKAGVLEAIASAFPQYAEYLLTGNTGIKQENPEVEKLSRKLPKAKKAS